MEERLCINHAARVSSYRLWEECCKLPHVVTARDAFAAGIAFGMRELQNRKIK